MSYDYPDLYYRIYPKILSELEIELDNLNYMDEISEEQMEKIVDNIYYDLLDNYPELSDDPYERKYRGKVRGGQRPFYGRNRIIRELITILLISELLRRNQYIRG